MTDGHRARPRGSRAAETQAGRWATTGQSSAALLEQAIAKARAGDRAGARALLRRVIHAAPDNEEAWLWLAWAAETVEQSLIYLREARMLFPESLRLREAMSWARQRAGLDPDVEKDEPPISPVAALPQRGGGLGEGARLAADAARRGAQDAVMRVRRALDARAAQQPSQARARETEPPAGPLALLERGLVPALTLLAIVMLGGFVVIGVLSARGRPAPLQALELEPPAEATPTLSIEQRLRPLWQQVDLAWTRQNWDGAVLALQRIRDLDPRNHEARERLAEAHYLRGVSHIRENRLDEARIDLDAAVRLNAADEDLQRTRRELTIYLDGLDAYYMRDWPRVISSLSKVHRLNPDFRDTEMMLAHAYMGHAETKYADAAWNDARDALLAEVEEAITPGRRIEVSLADQTVTLYEDHQPVHVFITCTGRPEAPTLPGRYEIQSKHDVAYGSQWNIYMPNWLGIYYAGGIENGFHGLPRTPDGVTVWRERLGRPCSFGCIVLETADAEFLYDWADLGTVVFIRP